MIPRRVKLSGFLCYKDEQEVAFDGSALWMLAGLNGSGKSTIFDAVTYALFGHHRGGNQQAVELINKDCDTLRVEFDFTLDGQLFQAKRTLKRDSKGSAKATQQVLHWHAEPNNGKGRWLPVEDTGQRRQFDAWVRDHIGLNYDTFTSSVLLLQGKAEKLMDSSPKGRSEVLAGIVDLERYQRLSERADERRKHLRGQVDSLQHQLDALPEVDPLQLLAVEERIETTRAERESAGAEVERLQALEFLARQWQEVSARHAQAQNRFQSARGLLAEAAAIERDIQRLRELRTVLPLVQTVVTQRANVQESEAKTRKLTEDGRKIKEKQAEYAHTLEQNKAKRELLQRRLTDDEARQRELERQLRDLAAALERLRAFGQREAERSRLEEELGRLPADPVAEVVRHQQAYDALVELGQAVSPLARLHAQRSELRQARTRAAAAERAEQEVQARGKAQAQAREELARQAEQAGQARRQADDQAAEARALGDQARTEWEEFRQLEGKRVCRSCGQALTPAHFQAELAKRERELAEADARSQKLAAAQRVARLADDKARAALQQTDGELQTAREEWREQRTKAEQSRQEVERLTRECGETYRELAEAYRVRVSPEWPADWAATAYPTADDLREVRQQADGLESARRRWQEAQSVQSRWNSLQAQAAAVRQAVEAMRAELPKGEPAAVQRRQVQAQAEESTLAQSLLATRAELREAQDDYERTGRLLAELQRQDGTLAGKLQTEEEVRRLCQQTSQQAMKALPEAWREPASRAALADQNRWRAEAEELQQQGVEARAEQLHQARSGLEALRQALAEVARERDAVPAEARCDPAEVRARLQQARQQSAAREEALRSAEQERALLEGRQRQRQQSREQLAGVEREHNYYVLLAQLLGRDRLQRHLVRRAERQIVDHANAVLDRLSGGQLALRLVGGGEEGATTERALDLEAYNRSTGGSAINVAFLSGSQRFRVAVSLALGIGQYASRQHRPIESVIIDEGFGCLDRQGRQVMIQELQNLRGHLHCILLVSHQEEFAEAFADGYHFELADGATRVTRIQR